jgi:hypothetical protein
MKKFAVTLAAVTLSALAFAGCGSQTSAKNPTAAEVYDSIQTVFNETYGHEAIENMPTEVNDTILAEKFHLSADEVDSYAGVIAGMMTNCDELVVVKAKDGDIENVEAALNQALEEQREAFSWYAVMYNPERMESAKVVTEGDYAALLIVGISPEEEDAENVDFTDDVMMAEKAFRDAVS